MLTPLGKNTEVDLPDTSKRTKLLHKLLKEQFGLESFRTFQEEIINDLLDNKNVMAILATGEGKSLLYQMMSNFLSKMR